MGGSRKTRVTGKHFRSPTSDDAVAGKFDMKKCNLRLTTHLITVRTQNAEVLKVGNVLPVALLTLASGPVAVVVDAKTKEAIGNLFPPEIDILIMCLERGVTYIAEIIESEGSDILVEISSGAL